MDETTAKALAYFREHWQAVLVGSAGSADAAELLDINPNTFKTRLARGQAMAFRGHEGTRRPTLTFTGYHLIYNYLSDRLLRFGFPSGYDRAETVEVLASRYAQWAFDHVLSPPHHLEAVLVLGRTTEDGVTGGVSSHWSGQVHGRDAQLIIPLGNMTRGLAEIFYQRVSNPDHARSGAYA